MGLIRFILASFVLFFFAGATGGGESVSCREIIQSMLDSIRNIRTQTCDVKAMERVDGHLLFAESHIKVNVSPRKIYFHNPEKGIEVLWVEGTNKGNASVHSRSVPLVNFDLDPYGSIMRKDQHHTVFELGSPYIGVTIANTIVKAPKDFDKHFAYAGTLTWNNHECYQILISYPEYKYVEYITKKGETVTSISQKMNTSDFKIRYKNDLGSYFGAIKEGKKLLIPVPYSNRAILFIDKKTFIPLNVKVYDEEGLFESYEFYNVKINPGFAANEFSKNYKDYGF
jgi:hypothetical protein